MIFQMPPVSQSAGIRLSDLGWLLYADDWAWCRNKGNSVRVVIQMLFYHLMRKCIWSWEWTATSIQLYARCCTSFWCWKCLFNSWCVFVWNNTALQV